MEDFVDVAVESARGVKRKAEELSAQAPKRIKVDMIDHYEGQQVPLTCSGP